MTRNEGMGANRIPGLRPRGRAALAYFLIVNLVFPAWIFAPAHAAYVERTDAGLPDTTDTSYDFAIADISGDGLPDVLVANGARSHLLINDGDGTFTDDTDARLPDLGDTSLAGVFVDVDGDGDRDIFLANTGRNRLLINDGTGVYTDETVDRLPELVQITMDVAAADVDGDGDPDLVLANRGGANRLLLNDGTGRFGEAPAGRLAADSALSTAVVLADLDGDGAPDIYFANAEGPDALHLNNGLGTYTDVSATALPATDGGHSDALAVDVDGDGRLDLAVGAGLDGVRLLMNQGSTPVTFADETAARVPGLEVYAIALSAGDVDEDGHVDLVLANAGADQALVNDGAGAFSFPPDPILPVDPEERRSFGIAAFDADGDLDADLLLATPQGKNRLLINDIAFPRIRLAVSPDYIEAGDPVTITIDIFDQDGASLQSLTADGVDITAGVAGGQVVYTPPSPGTVAVVATAVDTLGNVGTRTLTFEAQVPDTTAPVVTLGVTAPSPLLEGHTVSFQVDASDDRGVVARSLEVNGNPLALDTSGAASYISTGTADLNVVATATDAAGNTGSDATTLSVGADVVVPSVSVAATPDPVDLLATVTISVSAADNVGIAATSATISGPGLTGDVPLALDGGGTAEFTPLQPGTFTVNARATDPAGNTATATTSFEGVGVPDTEAPTVNLEVSPHTVAVGGTVDLSLTATDNVGVTASSVEVNGTPVILDADGNATFTAAVLGDYTVEARARDATGNETVVGDTFRAVDPASDTDFPTVAITGPGELAELTAPTPITGSAEDPTLVAYWLEHKAADSPASAYVEFGRGDAPVTDGPLATLDTTLLANGLVTVRLTALDINGRSSSTTRDFLVSGENKPGNFSIAFTDLQVPVSGVPISVRRIYDSRERARDLDFGHGWTLEVVKEGEYFNNVEPGEGWSINFGGVLGLPLCQSASPQINHVTEVRFSDTEFYRFVPVIDLVSGQLPSSLGCEGSVRYEWIGGVPGATLTPLGGTDVTCSDSLGLCYDTFDFEPYEPGTVRLTTTDGRKYDVNLTAGVTRIEDNNGNSLVINANGVVHSTGAAITFNRDGQGRITSIVDPAGNSLGYAYDAGGDLVTFTDRDANATTFVYDDGHFLTEIQDPTGNTPLRNEYDETGRLVGQVDGAGNRTAIDTDVAGNSTTVTDREGNPTVLVYNGAGLVTNAAAADGAEVTFTYDDRGNPVTRTDELGNTRNFTYDADNNLLSETDGEGNLTSYAYDGSSRPTSMTAPDGTVTSFTYDASGNLTAMTDGDGQVVQAFTYGAGGVITEATALGGITAFDHDAQGRVTGVQGPNGLERTMTYDANGRVLTRSVLRTTPAGVVTETSDFDYDNSGRLLRAEDAIGVRGIQTYDAAGQLETTTDGNGNTTTFEYNIRSELSKRIHPDATFEQFGYDLEGRLTGTTDRAGRTTFREFDARGRLVEVIYPDGTRLANEYDARGNLTAATDENGNRTTFEYDGNARRTKVTDALGHVTTMTYGPNGQLASITDALGRTTQYEYDTSLFGLNRLVRTIHPDGSDVNRTYDVSGRLATRTDENGDTVTYEYDDAGNLTRVIDPPGGETTYTYDEVGNRLTQTDGNGNTTRFEYDARGHMTSRTLPEGQRETFAYDGGGNLTSHVDFNGATTTYTYDSMDRLVRRTLPDASTMEYTYTATGQIETVTDANGVVRYDYDLRDRTTRITYPGGHEVSYGYDAAGNRTSVTSAAGTVDYAYDALDRLTAVEDPDGGVTTYTYDAVGNLTATAYANGAAMTATYDDRDRVTAVRHTAPGGGDLAHYTYTYDGVGNRTRMVDTVAGRTVDYAYDGLRRLVEEDDSGLGLITHAYDAVGNRTSLDVAGAVTTYVYDANDRLTSLTSLGVTTTFAYDAKGNQTGRTVAGTDQTQYDYDALNRLVRHVAPDTTATDFTYDHAGNRLTRDAGGDFTRFVVDPLDASGVSQVLAELDAGGAPARTYVHGRDLLRMEQGGSDLYYHQDALGSTGALSDGAGAGAATYQYDGRGNLTASSGGVANDYLFAGEQLDPNMGLYYLRARYMDPELGRFLTQDPLLGNPVDPRTLHRYTYAANNPVNFVDPTGQFTLAGVSISISISSVLSAISVSYVIYKDVSDIRDKMETLLETIPGLKLNESASYDDLTTLFTPTSASNLDDNLPWLNLGEGAVDQAYKTSEALIAPSEGLEENLAKLVNYIWRWNSASWMATLPKVDDKPGHYFACGYNDYIFHTYELQLVNGIATKPFKPAMQIIGLWLSYFNFLAFMSETLNHSSVNSIPTQPTDSCPLPNGS